jgi:RimJ/RimL family protein N-acetyltransferase
MNPLGYFHMQLNLEGIRRKGGILLESIPAESGDFLLALFVKSADGQTDFLQSGELPAEFGRMLKRDAKEIPSPDIAFLADLFSGAGPAVRVEHFQTYAFPEYSCEPETTAARCLSKHDSRVVAFGFGGLADEVFAVEEGGKILSACVSVRQNAECAEAWVFTAESHRRRGLARRAVRAWADGVRARNLEPLYSHKMENAASAGLARSLGLTPVFEEIQFHREGAGGNPPEGNTEGG